MHCRDNEIVRARSDAEDVERWPARSTWRDFSREEDRQRYDFSRNLSELLAPQWITPNVWNHLRGLIEWEIERAFAKADAASPPGQLKGLPTEALMRDEWEIVRDGLADLWAWWCDGAHLRPQIKTELGQRAEVRRAYVEDLIQKAVPQTKDWDEKLELESPISLDAHLGDGLLQICAWAHYLIAKADGWLTPRDKIQAVQISVQLWKDESEEILRDRDTKITQCRLFQSVVMREEKQWRMFAPTGQVLELFQRCITRVNAAEQSARAFQWDLSGVDLHSAKLDDLVLDGIVLRYARLDQATLEFASLTRG